MRRPSRLWAVMALAALVLWAGPALAQPARIFLDVKAAADGRVFLVARVVDARGVPVPESQITFKARTTFGWVTLGEETTDAAGGAQTALPPGLRVEVAAEAGGDPPVTAAIRLGERSVPEPRVRPGRSALGELSPQPGFISPYLVPLQVALLAVVLGGVWTTYAYVVWLLLQIRRAR